MQHLQQLHATLGRPAATGDGATLPHVWRFGSHWPLAPTGHCPLGIRGSGDAVVVDRGEQASGAVWALRPRRPRSTRKVTWHRRCPYGVPMDTSNPDATQLVPALEQAVNHLPSAGIAALIGDLERLQALLSARLLREA